MSSNIFASTDDLVVAACEQRGNQVNIVSVYRGRADGSGTWEKARGVATLDQMSFWIGESDRYMPARPVTSEGITYYAAAAFAIVIRPADAGAVIDAVVRKSQATVDPIPELAAAFASAREKITIRMTIQFAGAERRGLSVRVDDGQQRSLDRVLLSEAGVQALCRTHGWRAEGPFHQGGNIYNVVLFPGEQQGETISGRTDRQADRERQARMDSMALRQAEVAAATEGWDRYLVR